MEGKVVGTAEVEKIQPCLHATTCTKLCHMSLSVACTTKDAYLSRPDQSPFALSVPGPHPHGTLDHTTNVIAAVDTGLFVQSVLNSIR